MFNRTTDVGTFAATNAVDVDRFLRWRGVYSAADRSDIAQSFYLSCLTNGTLSRIADSTSYSNYICSALSNGAFGLSNGGSRNNNYRSWIKAADFIDDIETENKLGDSTTAVDNKLAIEHFQAWLNRQPIRPAAREKIDEHMRASITDEPVEGEYNHQAAISNTWRRNVKRYRTMMRAIGDIMYDDSELLFNPARYSDTSEWKGKGSSGVKKGWLKRMQQQHG